MRTVTNPRGRRPQSRRSTSVLIAAAAAAFTAGCADSRGFAAGLEAPKSAAWLADVTAPEIRDALGRGLRLEPPVRVVLVEGSSPVRLTWSDASVGQIDASFQRLVDADLVKEVLIASDGATPSPRETASARSAYLEPERLAAARLSGDIAVALTVTTRDDRWMNPLGVLYLSIVGLWLAPGHQHDVAARADAIAVDVRDGSVVATASGEGRVSRIRPVALLDEASDRAAAERGALHAVLPSLADRLRVALRAARVR